MADQCIVYEVKDILFKHVMIVQPASSWISPTEHILQCNQSEPLANASVRIVDIMNKNELRDAPINVTIIINHGAELRGAPINIAIII